MARGPYAETETTRLLRVLIAFAEDAMPTTRALTGSENRLRRGLHPLDWVLAGDAQPGSGPLTRMWHMNDAAIDVLRREVRAYLRFLVGDERAWPLPGTSPRLNVTLTPVRGENGRVQYHIDGSDRDVLLYQMKTRFDQWGGADRLRVCSAPDCGRVYLKIGRRENCSTRCQQRLYQRSYDPFAAKARHSNRPRIHPMKKGAR